MVLFIKCFELGLAPPSKFPSLMFFLFPVQTICHLSLIICAVLLVTYLLSLLVHQLCENDVFPLLVWVYLCIILKNLVAILESSSRNTG